MSCAICLESYLDQSRVPDVEKLPYLQLDLDKENVSPPRSSKSQKSCWFPSKGSKAKVDKNAAVVTSCGHVFHLSCITNWSDSPSKRKRECPICRKTIVLKNLIKLHLDTMNIIRQDTAIGVLVSMSVNQYNTLKDGFIVGYRNGQEKFTEVFQAKVEAEKRLKEQAEKEILSLKTENGATISKLETEKKLKEQALDEVSKWKAIHKKTVSNLQAERSLKVEAQEQVLKLKSEHAAEVEKLSGQIQPRKWWIF